MSLALLPEIVFQKYEVEETHHASSILYTDFREEWNDLVAFLEQFTLKKSHIIKSGGRKSDISGDIDSFFYKRGWIEHKFKIEVSADGVTTLAPT